jgi:hypothetical protein
MNCKTCNEPAPQFELVGGECIRCVAADRDRLREALEQLDLEACATLERDDYEFPCDMIRHIIRTAFAPVDKPPADELVCQPAATATTTQA